MMKFLSLTILLSLVMSCSENEGSKQELHWPSQFKNLKVGDKVPLVLHVSNASEKDKKRVSWAHWGVGNTGLIEIKDNLLIAKAPGKTKVLAGSVEIPGLVQEQTLEIQLPPLNKVTIQVNNQSRNGETKVGDTLWARGFGVYGDGAYRKVVPASNWDLSGLEVVRQTNEGIWFKAQKEGPVKIKGQFNGMKSEISLAVLKKEVKKKKVEKVLALSPIIIQPPSPKEEKKPVVTATENPLKVVPNEEGKPVVDLYSLVNKVKLSENKISGPEENVHLSLDGKERPINLFGVKKVTSEFLVKNFPPSELPKLVAENAPPEKRDLGRSIQSENPAQDTLGVSESPESQSIHKIHWKGEVRSVLMGETISADFLPLNDRGLPVKQKPEIRILTPEFLTLNGEGILAKGLGTGIIQVVFPGHEEFFHIDIFKKGPVLSEFHIIPSKADKKIPVGQVIEFFPMGVDEKGQILEDLKVYWDIEESEAGVLEMVGDNKFKAQSPGRALIKATVYGVENSHAIYPLDIVVPKKKKQEENSSSPTTSQFSPTVKEDHPYFLVR